MKLLSQSRHYRHLTGWYLAFISALTLATAFHVLRVESKWTLDDWLINYQGGFVRRGLTGQLILYVSHALHVRGLYPAALFATICYAVIFYAVWKLLKDAPLNIWTVSLVVSPVTLAFGVLDNRGWGHKEVLFLGGLAALLLMLIRPKCPDWLLISALSLYCPFLILCHEPLFFYLPYYAGAVLIARRNLKVSLKILVLPMLISAATLALVVHYPGNTATAEKICDSQGDPSRQICNGAISYLGTSKEAARKEVLGDAHRYHFYAMYSALTLFALIPFAITCRLLWRYSQARYELTVLAIAACLACAGSVLLFLYATDWGRWIYIHLLSIFLLLLFINHRQAEREPLDRLTDVASKPRWLPSLALFLYATCWSMPHWGNKPLLGYYTPLVRLIRMHVAGDRGDS